MTAIANPSRRLATGARRLAVPAFLATFAGPVAARAGNVAAGASAPSAGDTAWMLTATALVLMMTVPGLALFYGGMVRAKNVLGTLMQSFAITCVVSVLWLVLGYSLAFSDGGSADAVVGGFSALMHNGIAVASLSGHIPTYVFSMFQMTFAIIAPALIAGAFAERMKFSAMLVFTGAWSIIVYAPVAHWVWGGGFLAEAGVLDFAGGTVVHINAGVAGLVCALVLGKRAGYGRTAMAPHNLVLTVTGAALLWVGWFGFNAGSALAADGLAGVAMFNTQIAAAAAALAWMSAEWVIAGKPSVLGIVSGAIAGLVAVTPASGFVAPGSALIIGGVAGAGCYWAAAHLKNLLGYDDSLDAFGVHGIGGIIGALLTGVFADPAVNALGEGHNILIQTYGVVVAAAWSALASYGILIAINLTIGLRISSQQEVQGLDIAAHGESAYN